MGVSRERGREQVCFQGCSTFEEVSCDCFITMPAKWHVLIRNEPKSPFLVMENEWKGNMLRISLLWFINFVVNEHSIIIRSEDRQKNNYCLFQSNQLRGCSMYICMGMKYYFSGSAFIMICVTNQFSVGIYVAS